MDFITPIVEYKQKFNNARVFIKREDFIPFSFGGNKVRIVEEYYADMDSKGKNCIIGYGNARSNLCRVMANINSSRGGICHIISPSDDDGTRIETMNEKIVEKSGAIVHKCDKNNVSSTVEEVILECEEKGLSPYYMYGDKFGKGNEAVPTRAYVKVYDEIKYQSNDIGIDFDVIVLATGTGMTQAGLVAGRQLNQGNKRIVGISVARKKEQELPVISNFVESYFDSIDKKLMVGSLEVIDDYLCGGYGKYNSKLVETIKNVFFKYGIPLDPTYTGKAFYGMLNEIEKDNIRGNVLFIHTGGTPLFFDNINLI